MAHGGLRCPRCQNEFAWKEATNDIAARKFLGICLSEIPQELVRFLPSYFALFRSEGKPVRWVKLERLARELADVVNAEYHSWDGRDKRFIAPAVWQEAIEATIKSNPKALQNHNYLRHTAYDMADPNRKKEAPHFIPRPQQQPQPTAAVLGSQDTGRYKPLASNFDRTMSEEERQRNLDRAKEMANKLGKGMTLADPNKPKQ